MTSVTVPPQEPWLNPAINVLPSSIQGCGWFVMRCIPAGESVARLGGTVVPNDELAAMLAERRQDATLPYVDSITFGEGFSLVLPPETPNHYGNHSCDPNAWWIDERTLAARRDIVPGEEVTSDYGTSSDEPSWFMTCTCGSPLCRGVVTGSDWQRSELRRRYGRHWVPSLLRRIEARNS